VIPLLSKGAAVPACVKDNSDKEMQFAVAVVFGGGVGGRGGGGQEWCDRPGRQSRRAGNWAAKLIF
jgi:hypothetical protein